MNKTARAFLWASNQQFGLVMLNLFFSIYLARILDPGEFGLIGMITVFIGIGTALMSGGLGSSLIRTKNPSKLAYSTIFYSNILLAVLVYVLLFFLAPYISDFYDNDKLVLLIRVYSLSVIILSFSAIQLLRLTKNLDFKKTTYIQLPSILIGGITGVLFALNEFGVWSLVAMNLTKMSANSIQLWTRTKWYPDLVFSLSELKIHFNFGSKIALTRLINTVYDNAYNIIIGKYFNAQQLGFYTRANTLAQLPIANIQEILDRVSFPLLSEIQDDDVELRRKYKLILQAVFLIIAPIFVLGIVLAKPLFIFFLTEKWLPAVPYFQLICISGFFIPLGRNNLNVLKVKGKSGFFLRLSILEKILISVSILLTFKYGIEVILSAQIIVYALTFIINSSLSGNVIGYPFKTQIKDIFKSFIHLIIPTISIAICYSLISNKLNNISLILFCSLLFLIIYTTSLYLFKKKLIYWLLSLIKKKNE